MRGKQYNKGKHWKVKDTSNMNKDKIGRKRPPFSDSWKKNMSKGKIGKRSGNWKDGSSLMRKLEEKDQIDVKYAEHSEKTLKKVSSSIMTI